jgi:hypothetical protein
MRHGVTKRDARLRFCIRFSIEVHLLPTNPDEGEERRERPTFHVHNEGLEQSIIYLRR